MRGALLLVVGFVCCAFPLWAGEAGPLEIATAFEVELEPVSLTPVPRYLLIDDFESDSLQSHVGGFYDWDAASKSDRMTNCEITWVSEGASGGHLWSKYEYTGWLKVILAGLSPPLDASGYDGIEVTLWSDEPCMVDAAIGAWDEEDRWVAYRSESASVDGVPRKFRIPFGAFSPYTSSTPGIPQAHLARVNAIAFFPRNDEGSLYLDDIGLYGEDPAAYDASDESAEPLKGTITRYVSSERIPFTIRYECSFPGASGLEYHWEVASVGESDTEFEVARVGGLSADNANPSFLLTSNSEMLDTQLGITDAAGRTYEWLDLGVDIPLHNMTEITLDATRFVPEGEIVSVKWTAENGDPDDAKTFPIADPTAPITTLVSEWPNVLSVNCAIERRDGTSMEEKADALIYFRDGTPFEVRSTAATVFDATLPLDELNGLLSDMFPTLRRMGFNAVTHGVNWWYGNPDEQGVFTIHPVYDSTWRDRGGTISPDQLTMYLDLANEEGFLTYVQMRPGQYKDDPTLAQDYHASGWGTYAGFKNTDGYLYGRGEGYENMLLHYLPLFVEYDVAGVFLGVEVGNMEAHGGAKTRVFLRDIIGKYRAGGHKGAISYAPSYYHNPDWRQMPPFRLENLEPSQCGIPWGDMDYVALTFYPTLTQSFDASTQEMYVEAQSQIDEYLRPFHEIYGKPLFIEDMYCIGSDGGAIRPTSNEWRLEKEYDPEEQRRWHTALLRAFAEENMTSSLPWIAGITMYEYWLNPSIADAPFEARAMKAYINAVESEHLRLLAKVFFRDVPLED